jgi:hypothetical protein
MLSFRERCCVWENHGLGLAAKHMPDPAIAVDSMSHVPVEAHNLCCQRFACLVFLSCAILGHRNYKARSWPHDRTCVGFHDGDRTIEATLAILRQPVGKEEVRVDPLRRFRLGGHGSLCK